MSDNSATKRSASKAGSLLKNTGILAIGSFSSKILVFLLVPLYTSVLTTGEYGSYDIIYSTVSLIAPVLTLNISEALLRFPMEKDADVARIAQIGLALTVGSVVPVVIAQFIPDAPWKSLEGIEWLAPLYASFTLYQSLTLLARGLERMGDIAIAGVVSAAILVSLNIVLLIFAGFGIDGFFAANVASFMLPSVWLTWRMRREIFSPSQEGDEGLFVRMIRYSFPLATATIGWWLIGVSDRYVVLAFCGVNANGLYSVAYRIPSIVSTVASIFIQAWQVSAVKEFDSEDTDGFLRRTYASVEALVVLMCSILIPLSPGIATVMFAGDFYEAWVYVPLLLVYAGLNAMAGMWGPFFSAGYDPGPMAISTFLSGAVNVVTGVPLVMAFGVQGACLSSVMAGFANWGLRAWRARRHVSVSFAPARSLLLYLLLGLQAVLMVSGLPIWMSAALQFVLMMTLFVFLRREFVGVLGLVSRKFGR